MTAKLIFLLITTTAFLGMTQLVSGSAVLIADMTMSVMVELSSRHPFCKMHTDRGDIQRMLLQSDQRRIRQVPRESVMELEDVCQKSGNYGYDFRGGLGFIYPGTKWCGPGNTAADYNDLGQHIGEDRCCREHDHCPNVLNVGECRRGLCNTGTFTRSHCDCDARLRRCLQSLNTETANTLGAIFYNVVQVTCFQERSPCSAHQRFEDFFYKTRQCDILFRPADFYVPPNMGNLIEKILSHPYGLAHTAAASHASQRIFGRSLDSQVGLVPTLKQNFNQFSKRVGVKLASVGLAAVNIFREIVRRPEVVFDSLYTPVRRDLPPDSKNLYESGRGYPRHSGPSFPENNGRGYDNRYYEYSSSTPNRAGYNKTEQEEICAQWQFRPSEKYVPSAPGRV